MLNMSSRDLALRLGEARSGRITKPKRQSMIAHSSLSNKDNFLRGAPAMVVDFSKFRYLSSKKYGEPLCEPVHVCGFEKTVSGFTIDRLLRPDSSGDGLH